MFNNLVNFSLDLYDLDSDITLEISTDNITINFNGGKKAIVLLIEDDQVYPELVHNLHSGHAIPIDTVIKVLEIAKKYM